jgi:hypothetical protein
MRLTLLSMECVSSRSTDLTFGIKLCYSQVKNSMATISEISGAATSTQAGLFGLLRNADTEKRKSDAN